MSPPPRRRAVSVTLPGSLFIDGTWQDARSGRLLHVLDPVDGSLVVTHDAAGLADVVAVLRSYADLALEEVTRHVDAGPDVDSRVVAEPAGVCALVTPWNYPLLSVAWKLAPALA